MLATSSAFDPGGNCKKRRSTLVSNAIVNFGIILAYCSSLKSPLHKATTRNFNRFQSTITLMKDHLFTSLNRFRVFLGGQRPTRLNDNKFNTKTSWSMTLEVNSHSNPKALLCIPRCIFERRLPATHARASDGGALVLSHVSRQSVENPSIYLILRE